MRNSLIALLILVSFGSMAQTLDFGVDLNINVNLAHDLNNSSYDREFPEYIFPPFEGSIIPEGVILPNHDYGYMFGQDSIYVRFNNKQISNNVEVPIYARYTTKNNFFFDFAVSFMARYELEYTGTIHRPKSYYNTEYGDLQSFIDNYGGAYDNWPVAGSPGETYNDTTAFMSWYDQQIYKDPYRQIRTQYREEFQFTSFYLGAGYRFARHRDLHPYVYLGLGARFPVDSYSHEYWGMSDPDAFGIQGISPGEIYIDGPTWSYRGGVGIEFYRYHAGVNFQFTQNPDFSYNDETGMTFDYRYRSFGFSSISFSLGADIFSFHLNTSNTQNETYDDEYAAVSSKIDKRRRWGVAASLGVPVFQHGHAHGGNGFIMLDDVLDLTTLKGNQRAEIVSIREVDRLKLSPEFKLGVRYGLSERFSLELVGTFSHASVYSDVFQGNYGYKYDTIANKTIVDTFNSSWRDSYLNTQFYPIGVGLNVYPELFNNSIFSIRGVLGARANFIFVPYSARTTNEAGVNGTADGDVYEMILDAYWLAGGAEDMTNSFYVKDVSQFNIEDPLEILKMEQHKDDAKRMSDNAAERRPVYIMATAGAELEFNRILVGLGFDFSLGGVDGLFLDSYQTVNLSIGYMLFESYKVNRKIKTTF